MSEFSAEAAVGRFLACVEARDLDGLANCFAEGARYGNQPHEPVRGPAGIRDLFAPILGRATRVKWDIIAASYQPTRAFLERIDRFWIDGAEYSIECNGVYEVDPATGLIVEVRDYVDLGVWRQRLPPAGL